MTTTATTNAADISASTLAMLRKLYERSKRSALTDDKQNTPAMREAAEQEAAQAAQMLDRLLNQYGLALADVDSQGNAHQISHSHVRETKLDFGKSAFTWKIELARHVIRYNHCQVLQEVYTRNKLTGFVLVGLELHVEATMMLLEWLFAQIKGIASADYKQWKQEHPWQHIDPLRWHTNFGKGAGERLAARLQQQRDEEQWAAERAAQESAGGRPESGLAINIGTAIRDYLESKDPARRERRLAEEAYQARVAQRQAVLRVQTKAWPIWVSHLLPYEQFVILAGYQEMEAAEQRRIEIRSQEWQREYAESAKTYAQRDRARERRRERYYEEHGYYPEDRPTARRADTTEYRAYDRGYERAESINLRPHLDEGKEAALAALR